MTTRRFPRTLDQAFPTGAAYGCAITRPRHSREQFLDYCLAVVIGCALACALVAWWAS